MPLLLTNYYVNGLVSHFSKSNFSAFSLIAFSRKFFDWNNYNKKVFSYFKATQNNDSTVRGRRNENSVIIKIEPDENTPLLHKPKAKNVKSEGAFKKSDYFRINALGIAMLLIGGMSIATYLLLKQCRLPVVRFSLDLVNRDVWSEISIPLGKTLNDTLGLHVLLLQTGTEKCADLDSCTDILRNMQKAHTTYEEIPYNFLIGGNGQAYEVRGWNHESGLNLFPQQTSLVIGFIGNYTTSSPSDDQFLSALSVVHEFVRRKKLHTSYQVFGIRNLSISHIDGEALFSRVSNWQRFDALLHVL